MWIQDYREREKLELYQFQQLINIYNQLTLEPLEAIISGRLIYILERNKGAVTHPIIADMIAEVCQATTEQRDMIVADIHKGTWKLTDEAKERLLKARLKYEDEKRKERDYKEGRINQPQFGPHNKDDEYLKSHIKQGIKQAIVKIDICGNVVERYDSLYQAVLENNVSQKYIKTRCMKRIKNEFGLYNDREGNIKKRMYSYRYACEWDDISHEDRIKDINITAGLETE